MFTPIHQSLGLEAGDVNIDLIQQAVAQKVEETDRLDWKRECYNSKNPKWQDEAAKDVAAMANSGGGWIVFGVSEDVTNNSASEITPIDWDSPTQQRILQATYSRISPPVVGLEFYLVEYQNGYVVMMRVPDSPDAPHFATRSDNTFTAPRRNGPHTVYMSEREIERGFRERFQRAHNREQELQALFEQAVQGMNPEEGLCIAFAAQPIESANSNNHLDRSDAENILRSSAYPSLFSTHPGLSWDFGDTLRGMRRWSLRNRIADRWAFRKTLLEDGAALACYKLGGVLKGERDADAYPVDQPNHCRSDHIEEALVDFISLVRRYASKRQINGGYRIRTALIGLSSEPIFIRTFAFRSSGLIDIEYLTPITHFQPITMDIDPLSSTQDLLASLNVLALDIINQGGVENLQRIVRP
ncbi:AlbA family DNA-binding domain-containing protein [Arcanobacterium phocae]|uniref:AlbA family DNA-binding domain-containing protein n=1 Tax=Arcanobacterium phocae TaxID=131112 RepID=UPI001C0EE9A4|nr:ATP-binding protein [Arcanobacterium phocae]